MDIVLKLRELRARAGLTQEEVARRSGVGVKTLSSFESGARTPTMKLAQLEAILRVYRVTLVQFFSRALERELAPWESAADPVEDLVLRIEALPPHVRSSILHRISGMLDGIDAMTTDHHRQPRSTVAHHAHLH